MADEEGKAGGVEVAHGADWACSLMSIERVQADVTADAGEDIFTAIFQMDGLNANAEVEIVVSDFDDEAEIVSIALHTLHLAMRTWGRITENRRIAARDFGEPTRD